MWSGPGAGTTAPTGFTGKRFEVLNINLIKLIPRRHPGGYMVYAFTPLYGCRVCGQPLFLLVKRTKLDFKGADFTIKGQKWEVLNIKVIIDIDY